MLVIGVAFVIAFFVLQKQNIPDDGDTIDTTVPSSRPPITTPGGNTDPSSSPSPTTSPISISDDVLDSIPFVPKLRQITSEPVAGAVLYPVSLKSSTTTTVKSVIRYMERATGHIYQTEKDSLINNRITSTRIPKVYEAKWIKDGSSVYARYLDDTSNTIETFFGEIKSAPKLATSTSDLSGDITFAPGELKGTFLTKQIANLTTAPHKKSLFYINTVGSNGRGGAVGTTASADGSARKEIFSSPLSEWLPTWIAPSIIALQTKPTAAALSVLYVLNPETLALSRIVDGVGLIGLPNRDGSLVVTSETAGQGLYSSIFNTKTGIRIDIPETIAEKCVWGKKNKKLLVCAAPKTIPEGRYPDIWYQGLSNFDDRIVSINIETGRGTILTDLYAASLSRIDAVDLEINESDDYIIFTNRRDGSLWGLSLLDE